MNKYKKLHEAIGITEQQMNDAGVHNGYLEVDSEFYIDPDKLKNTTEEEFVGACQTIQEFFNNLVFQSTSNPITEVNFPEMKEIALGYSYETYDGRGLAGQTGVNFYSAIRKMASLVADNDSLTWVDLLPITNLVVKNIGMDRVTDMIAHVIIDRIVNYTDRKMKEFGVTATISCEYNKKTVNLHTIYRDDGKKTVVLLLPKSILSPISSRITYKDIAVAINNGSEKCKVFIYGDIKDSMQKLISYLKNKDKTALFSMFCNENCRGLIEKTLDVFKTRTANNKIDYSYDRSLEYMLDVEKIKTNVLKNTKSRNIDFDRFDLILEVLKQNIEEIDSESIIWRSLKVNALFKTIANVAEGVVSGITKVEQFKNTSIMQIENEGRKIFVKLFKYSKNSFLRIYKNFGSVIGNNHGYLIFANNTEKTFNELFPENTSFNSHISVVDIKLRNKKSEEKVANKNKKDKEIE